MKKAYIIVAAIAALFLFPSCNKMETDIQPEKVSVKIKVADFDAATKAVKTSWAEGDKINIWFNDVPAGHYSYWKELPHLVLTYTSGSWSASSVDEELLSASGTFKAVYEASNAMFASIIDSDYAYYPRGTDFKHTELAYNSWTYTRSLSCFANGITYTYNSSTHTLSGTISGWQFATRLQIVVTGLNTADPDRYALTFDGERQVDYADALYCVGTDITPSASATCNGIKTSGWSNGEANPDGIAFCFYRAYNSESKLFTMYLVDKTAKKTYKFSKTTAIDTPDNSVKSIKLDISLFGNDTENHPLD